MKKKPTLILRACGLLLLSLCLLAAAMMPATAQVAEDPFHYALPGTPPTREIAGDELFAMLFDGALHETERAYLARSAELSLRLHDRIPTDIVTTEYDGEKGILTLHVPAYTYVAANGFFVTWVPTVASMDGVSQSFVKQEDGYACSFRDLFYSEDFDVSLSFSCTLTLPASTADLLLTRPWEEGSAALEELLDYEENVLAPYLVAKEKFEVYTAYLAAVEAYNEYLKDLDAYKPLKDAYDEYLVEYEAYSAQLSAHEAWLKYKADDAHYWAYQDFLKNDLENYNAYLQYQNQMNEVWERLNILEALFSTDSNGWQLYASLMGNTVTSVVERRAELVAAGCDPKNIETAGTSTVELRKLMKGYADLRGAKYESDYARTKALYAYYTENHTKLGAEYAKLYGALKALYDNEIVYMALIKEGKLEHFQQFVGQLYVTATCLDDSVTRSASWKITKKTLAQVVEPAQLLTDTNKSHPDFAKLPESEVAYVEAVEPIEKPSPVPEVAHPGDPPRVVGEPTKPTEPPKPDTDNPPPVADDPGKTPAPPAMEESLLALAEAIRRGEVTKRAAKGRDRELTFTTSMTCPISIHNLKTVRFYDHDGKTLLWQTQVDYGEGVSYRGPSMMREDPNYVYEFLGWVFADGTPASYGSVTSNLSIYANYRVTPRQYTVTWVLDGVTKVTAAHYGTLPTCPFLLTKSSTTSHDFSFSGWDREVVAVTENVTYVGSFVASPRQYTVRWITNEGETLQSVAYGERPIYPGTTPASRIEGNLLYTFSSWDRSTETPVTGDVTFRARYTSRELVKSTGAGSISVVESEDALRVLAGESSLLIREALSYADAVGKSLTVEWNTLTLYLDAEAIDTLLASDFTKLSFTLTKGEGGRSLCRVRFTDAFGKEIAFVGLAASAFPVATLADGSSFVYQTEDGAGIDGAITVDGSFAIVRRNAFGVSAEENAHCDVGSLASFAAPGDEVLLDMTCTFGYGVVGAELILEDGSMIRVEGKSFIMPEGNVKVRLQVERIVYHVTFVVNGTVYHEADYYLGEQIVLPAPPTLADDGEYSYTFSKWSPLPTIAVGEDTSPVFEAVFSKTALNAKDPYKAQGNNNRFLTVVLPILLGVVAIAVGAVIFLRLCKKRKTAEFCEDGKEKKTFFLKVRTRLWGLLHRKKKD